MLKLNEEMAALPVTDIVHVIREINIDRKAKDAIRLFYKRKAAYYQKYAKRQKSVTLNTQQE